MVDLGKLKITIDTGADEAKKELSSLGDNVQKQEGKMSKSMSNIAKGVIAAFSVRAIINFGKKTVEASAELQAMEAQFDQVFKGEENTQALDRINNQVEDLGINADRLTSSWNSFGGQVKGAGMDSEMALEAVDKATRLAADSAAFYDKSLEESSASLASFMKGNFAAGDAIGVFTNAKQMDVKANEMYDKSWADLTESERQWLLLDTVDKTYEMNGAMGQASREAGSYENVMGNLRATFERLYATIGEPILEAFLVVVQNVTAWIEGNMPLIETTINSIFEGIKTTWDNVLSPVLTILWDILKGIVQWVADNWGTVETIFRGVFEAIKFVWDNVLSPTLGALWDIFEDIIIIVEDNFPAIQKTVETVFGGIGKAVEIVTGIFWGVVDAIKAAIDWLSSWNNKEVQQKRVDATADARYDGSHADGLDYVPFDNYKAILHKGEKVLTAKDNTDLGGKMSEMINAVKSLESTLVKKDMSVNIGEETIGKTAIKYANERNKITGEFAFNV